MGTHSNILAWDAHDRGAWWVTDHGVTKSQTRVGTQSIAHELCERQSSARTWELLNRVASFRNVPSAPKASVSIGFRGDSFPLKEAG